MLALGQVKNASSLYVQSGPDTSAAPRHAGGRAGKKARALCAYRAVQTSVAPTDMLALGQVKKTHKKTHQLSVRTEQVQTLLPLLRDMLAVGQAKHELSVRTVQSRLPQLRQTCQRSAGVNQ